MPAFIIPPLVLLCLLQVENERGNLAPPNEPPQLLMASASRQNGESIVQISRPEFVAPRKAVPAEVMKWENLRPVKFSQIKAFGVDGRPLGQVDVLKALKQPKGVAVFLRYYRPLLEPDPFYLAMLREGTIVLVVAVEDVGPLEPGP